MGSISIQNVTVQFGGQVVLDNVSAELHSGEIVGIVGPNGAGKTTLFRLITGELTPEYGTVTRSRGMDVGYLPQEPQIALDKSLHDEVLSVFADVLALERKLEDISQQMADERDPERLERLMKLYDDANARFVAAGGYDYEHRLGEILGGLGFSQADRSLPMSALSGGQRCRAALAKLLLQDSRYLLLDEPTNHLDIDAVRWLEKFLAGHHGGAAIISHDRYLLDRLVDRIIEVDRGRLTAYPGNYSNYCHVRELRELTEQRRYERDREYVEKEQQFITKHLAGQRTREAQGRRKRLERRIAAGEFRLERPPRRRRALSISFGRDDEQRAARYKIGHVVAELQGLAKSYGDKRLFADLDLQIAGGQRLGITGPNGTGKTTLLRILLGELAPDAGSARLDPHVSVGYYAQQPEELEPGVSVLAHVLAAAPHLGEQQARDFLAAFLFVGDDVFKPADKLSGGEQSRLRLARLVLAAPAVLILDEPTNHLDIPAREALEAALVDYPGTIVTVSHDRYFLDRICRRLLVLRPEGHRLVPGNYSDYVALLEEEARQAQQTEAARQPRRRGRADRSKPAERRREASRFERMKLDELEEFIIAGEQRLAELEKSFADASVYRDGRRVAELRAEFERLKSELAEAQSAWERRVEQM